MILGIDGMDRRLVKRYAKRMPVLSALFDACPWELTSIYPPDSDTAWASIYTGLNPAEHGVVEFVDPMERSTVKGVGKDFSFLQGRTFWDAASAAGRTVCVLNPHLGHEVWTVNGVMAHRRLDGEGVRTTGDLSGLPPMAEFGGMKVRIPRTKFEHSEYLRRLSAVVEREFAAAEQQWKARKWDLFFYYSSSLDSIMHLFWSYCDPDDPTHPGPNPFFSVIEDAYARHDELVGRMIAAAGPDTAVMILSDHGHGMRPIKLFNVNQVLHEKGYLPIKGGVRGAVALREERLKRGLADLAQRSGLRPAAMRIVRMFPGLKKAYTQPSAIDFDKAVAHGTDLSGMKAYSYGGVVIRREHVPDPSEYERIRQEIIDDLTQRKTPDTGESIMKWVRRREDLYSGPHVMKYPDIVFYMRREYGAGWGVGVPTFSHSTSHKFFPGSHDGETPVLGVSNGTGIRQPAGPLELMDIRAMVADLLGLQFQPNAPVF